MIIQATEEFVRSQMQSHVSHDWWHVYRVWQLAKRIGKAEQADLEVVELAALLHDIADHKYHNGDHSVGPRVAREWLESQRVDPTVIDQVVDIISNMSFSSEKSGKTLNTIEGFVVQDADRLDAIGAIGLARVFTFGGEFGQKIFDPESDQPTSISHFDEKLLLIKDKIKTETGRKIAEERHQYLVDFLKHFHHEWEATDAS